MKKLLFIASVGLLFSCSNGAGTCVCTTTATGSDINLITTPNPSTVETYYENDAQEYCDTHQSQAQQIDEMNNNQNAQLGIDIYQSTSCVVE